MFAKLSNNRKLEEATSTKDDVAPSVYPGLHLCDLLDACLHPLPLYSQSCLAAPTVHDHGVHLQP